MIIEKTARDSLDIFCDKHGIYYSMSIHTVSGDLNINFHYFGKKFDYLVEGDIFGSRQLEELIDSLIIYYGLTPIKESVSQQRYTSLTITKVIFNPPVTIVFWSDGTKTIVKCDSEVYDEEKGLAMAISKKFLGTNKSGSNYYDIFKKWLPDYIFKKSGSNHYDISKRWLPPDYIFEKKKGVINE